MHEGALCASGTFAAPRGKGVAKGKARGFLGRGHLHPGHEIVCGQEGGLAEALCCQVAFPSGMGAASMAGHGGGGEERGVGGLPDGAAQSWET